MQQQSLSLRRQHGNLNGVIYALYNLSTDLLQLGQFEQSLTTAQEMLELSRPMGERSGELICLAEPDAWFTYYYWLDDAKAPDFARTVDIHRKPGYDPVELFLDPAIAFPKLKIATTLARRKLLNQRPLMEVIPLDATLVKGSHGRPPDKADDGPLVMTNRKELLAYRTMEPTRVFDLMLGHLAGS